ncbi:MAG: sulfotransferase [Pseudomonadota bacterium]
MKKSSDKRTPLFIVGMNGSGTTMLADCLSRHPECFVFLRETRVIPFFYENKDKYGDLKNPANANRLLADMARSFAFWREDSNAYRHLTVNSQKHDFSSLVEYLYCYYSRGKNYRYWIDKTPMYAMHIDLLANAFPTAKFIHIYRDGRDCAQSLHRRWLQSPVRTIYKWKKLIAKAGSDGATLESGRYMTVCYEALTKNPETIMHEIIDFLGIEYSNVLLKSAMPYVGSGGRRRNKTPSGQIFDNSSKWRTYFTEKQIFELESIAGFWFEKMGYEILSDADDKDISEVLYTWLEVLDKIRNIYCKVKYHRIGNFFNREHFLKKAGSSRIQSKGLKKFMGF